MPPQVVVKVTYNSELRRTSFANAQAFTYSKLHTEFSRMFSLSEPFKVYYIDDDEDEVLVTSDQDLAEALSFFQTQRAEPGKVATCRFTIKHVEGKGEEPSTKKQEETTEKPRSNAWADLAQNFVDHLEQEMSFIQGSAQSSASALAAAAASASQNWQRAFTGQSTQPSNAAASQSEPTNVESQLHANVMCDQCYRAVRGTRWKCQDCRDYDLCDGCKTAGQYNHPTHHSFRSMAPPAPTPSINNRAPHCRSRFRHRRGMRMHGSATCDFCDSLISGTRHKCKDCPDFDLCEQCIVLADSQHPGHTFEVFQRGCRRSSQYQRPPVASEHDTCHHSGVRCDGCEKWIYGVRYKCGNCADFDFCSKCEASANHDPKHVFLKIKRPVNGPIFSNVPLLPNLYAFTPPAHAPPAAQTPQMRQKETSASNTAFGVFPRNAGSFRSVDERTLNELGDKLERLSTNSSVKATTPEQTLEKPSELSPAASVSSTSQPELFARFVDDVNIPDGTVVVAKSRFLKIWNMTNEGNQEWPQGTQLIFCGGDMLSPSSTTATFAVPVTKPGKNAYVTADLQAPSKPGRYVSYFRLVTPTGTRFGHRVWCDIVVENEEQQGSSASSSQMIYPTLINREGEDDDKATIRTEEGSHHTLSGYGSFVATPSVRSVSESDDNDSIAPPEFDYDTAIRQTGEFDEEQSEFSQPHEDDAANSEDGGDYIVIEQEDESSVAGSFHNIHSASTSDNSKETMVNPFLAEKELEDEMNSSSKVEESPQRNAQITADHALAEELDQLHDMGFYHDEMNIGLLEAYGHNMENVVLELLRMQK
ncbi:hypothetical protein NQZ79_g5478 [Umbelopsis isabellina]|nr:hypothetical protein NQZ79_g5478 [Umbelopsis isabellina]